MAYYSAGVLICLCPYFICWASVASDANDARSGYKGRYGPDPAHYELVVPLKVTEAGEFISHTIPHHYKRSYYGTRSQKDMGSQDMVHYIVPIAGEKHHLELLPSNNIVSPGMVVEVHDNKGISHRDIHRLGNIQCHYAGSVRGHEDSRAALSTCYGLAGYIRTKNGYYFIEPSTDHDPLSGKRHPHHLYMDKRNPVANTSNCDNSYDCEYKEPPKKKKKKPKHIKNITELHIEAMVVLDKSLLNYHKCLDVENYVLTVFNMAHDLYHDATLGTNINLVIVRMIRLEEEEHKMNLAVNKDAKKTLKYFQDWQSKMNPGDDTHPNHHDVAVLLTRIDICGDDKTCGLLGAAITGGMCERLNSVALCEDNGLRLGFVIAHEIAHTMAIPHDNPKECGGCDFQLPEGLTTVMNPTVGIRTAEWSNCSSKFLKEFIEQVSAKCLFDPPTDHSFEMPDILPGVMYGGDFQCRQLFGPNAALCDTGIDCQNLVCYLEDKGCVETHSAAAPGTNCGEKQWCYRGKCLGVGERPGAVDGGWSPWSEWGECSRTCGSGIASQERHCNKPSPAHGGKYCSGEHKHHRICNTEPCGAGEPTFRNVQCAEFNDWVYPEDNKMHEWKAYHMPDENPCILFCVNDDGEVASLRPRVVDGTKCLRGMRDVCIDGICREIPCDLDLESNAVEDWCGVCHGDGTSCDVISGHQFVKKCAQSQSQTNTERIKVLDIPAGSMNIKIEEMTPSDAKLQVGCKDEKTMIILGDTFGTFNVSGTKAWLGNIRTKQQALTLPGCISEAITIWIEAVDNVTIKYSYGVPINGTNKRTPCFDWDYVDWTRCSTQCGPGTQEAIPRCVEKTAGLVDQCYCKGKKKLKERIRPCEVGPCIPRWMIGDWQNCTCPQGRRFRVVKCVKPTGEGEGESDVIANSNCYSPKPKEKEKCMCTKTDVKVKVRAVGHKTKKLPWRRVESKQSPKRNLACMNLSGIDNDCDTTSAPKRDIVIDIDCPPDLSLVVHSGSEEENAQCRGENCTITLENKKALEFLNEMQKNFSNNKTRI